MFISVFIAACALFTAVYDGLKSRDVSPTSILNAATVNHTGKNTFGVNGTGVQCNTTTTLSFDNATYVIIFCGQNAGYSLNDGGTGAICIAFYKGSNMTVSIGVGGGRGGSPYVSPNAGGKTIVQTNFAVPDGYGPGLRDAIASGAGAGSIGAYNNHGWTDTTWRDYINPAAAYVNMDGTFKGFEPNGSSYNKADLGDETNGQPATQTGGGWCYVARIDASSGSPTSYAWERTPNPYNRSAHNHWRGVGGGAGYYDGGCGCLSWGLGGGGSCTPWCYPLQASDVDNGIRLGTGNGWVDFFRIDPTVMPSGAEANLAEDQEATAAVTAGGVGAYTPVSAVKAVSSSLSSYSCGIETGWVFRWRRL